MACARTFAGRVDFVHLAVAIVDGEMPHSVTVLEIARPER